MKMCFEDNRLWNLISAASDSKSMPYSHDILTIKLAEDKLGKILEKFRHIDNLFRKKIKAKLTFTTF